MEFISLQTLLITILPFLYLYFHYFITHSKPHETIKPGFKLYPLLGTLPDFIKNRHRFLDWSTNILALCPTNTSTFWRPGKVHGIITANPSNVEHMLKTNFENYPKGDRFIALLQDFLGQGIFNSDGEIWKLQRKTASYEFNTKSLRNFVMENVVVEIQNRLVPVLNKAASTFNKDGGLNMQDVLERFAFDNICKVAFNVDPNCLGGETNIGDDFMRAFDAAANFSSGRFMYAFPQFYRIKRFFNFGSEKMLKQSVATVHEFADSIIRSRLINNGGSDTNEIGHDLLSRFIGNHESSPEFLRDIIISFILAGRDTTSSALCWFFWLLSSRPEVKRKIRSELEEIRLRRQPGSDLVQNDFYNFNELREMHYLQAALSETMRLYPPIPVDTKACLNDDIMPDGTFVGKGWFVTYHAFAMGRMENIWGKNCTEFVPERWIDENGVCRTECPFKYPIFHAGARMCLGKDMAYIQMKSIAAAVIERFNVDVLEESMCPEYVLALTLRMKGGLRVRVQERC